MNPAHAHGSRFRSAEWLYIIYFAYVALVSTHFPLDPGFFWRPFLVELLVCVLFFALSYGELHENQKLFAIVRDWTCVSLILIAYHEMNWFSSIPHNFRLELRWEMWDRTILFQWGLQRAIESLGVVGPLYFELCYLLVYAVAPFFLAVLYFRRQLPHVNAALFLYLLGTLLAYALLPFFPSDPPRVVFGGSDLPNVFTPIRALNLWLVNDYGIHSSVFPSAHVSSAFSAAWSLFAFLPNKRYGWGMLIYAVSVAVATVYGRYHYAADAVAGFAVSLVPAATILLARPLRLRGLLGLP